MIIASLIGLAIISFVVHLYHANYKLDEMIKEINNRL